MPAAITGVFQGILLLSLLTADTFIHFRLRRTQMMRHFRIGMPG